MSTKIFVHRQLKIKPPKPPDPNLDRLFEAQAEERRRKEAQHAEDRRAMAQLRAEELAQRAAKLPRPRAAREVFCCPRCWAIDKGQLLFSKRKTLFRIWRAIETKRPDLLGEPWLTKARLELAEELIKLARLEGVQVSGEEMADYVILISNKVLQMGIETFNETHPKPEGIAVATIYPRTV